jgi:redox-sensitive bicupin YhaK (pirin superfamily)
MPDLVLGVRPLGFPWPCDDPFLFCVHHDDAYPAGNAALGPDASLAGRRIGEDFAGKDGWRMYHGDVVPGFPHHPHRGFETVTIVRRGFVDHSDSLGATARFGKGDAQWLTAGGGIVHSEMFPLLHRDAPNPLELFQIWLNLPGEDKMVAPHFAMIWGHEQPIVVQRDDAGREARVTVVAGALGGAKPPAPPPKSWAARPDAHVAIWTIRLAPGARWTLPRASAEAGRTLYFFRGKSIAIGDRSFSSHAALKVRSDADVLIENGPDEGELLLLQGRPIAQPVVQYGPFVMNSREQIEAAFADYRRTRFGGWPWSSDGPVHAREAGRFAKHADGHVESVDDPGTADAVG